MVDSGGDTLRAAGGGRPGGTNGRQQTQRNAAREASGDPGSGAVGWKGPVEGAQGGASCRPQRPAASAQPAGPSEAPNTCWDSSSRPQPAAEASS